MRSPYGRPLLAHPALTLQTPADLILVLRASCDHLVPSSRHRYMGRLAALAEAEEARDLFSARAQTATAPAASAASEAAAEAEAAEAAASGHGPAAAAAAAEAVVAGLAEPAPLPPGSLPFPLFWRRMLEVRRKTERHLRPETNTHKQERTITKRAFVMTTNQELVFRPECSQGTSVLRTSFLF